MSQPRDAGQGSTGSAQALAILNASKPHVCPFCRKSYVRQERLEAHVLLCQSAHHERQYWLKRAFPLYERWFKSKGRSLPLRETFDTSRFGTLFVKFVQWCDTMKVVSPTVYASIMISAGAHPSVWSTTTAYKLYVAEFDAHVTPEEWLLITVATMERVTAERMTTIGEFYNVCPPNEMMHLIRTKAVYPRYLVCDPRFNTYVSNMAPPVAKMLAELISDQYMVAHDPCDAAVLAVLKHVDTLSTTV